MRFTPSIPSHSTTALLLNGFPRRVREQSRRGWTGQWRRDVDSDDYDSGANLCVIVLQRNSRQTLFVTRHGEYRMARPALSHIFLCSGRGFFFPQLRASAQLFKVDLGLVRSAIIIFSSKSVYQHTGRQRKKMWKTSVYTHVDTFAVRLVGWINL